MNRQDKLRVGLVAEGPSDWMVIEAVARSLLENVEFVPLKPDVTLTNQQPGWRGVRAWCRENGPRLELLMRGVPSRPIHLLIVHADCSMSDKEGIDLPCPPALAAADALRSIIASCWLGRDPPPSFLVIDCPAQSHEAWVVAALDPPYGDLANIECDRGVEEELARRKLLRKKDGEVKKAARLYQPLAERVGQMFDSVCEHCEVAADFRGRLIAAVPLTSEDPVSN